MDEKRSWKVLTYGDKKTGFIQSVNNFPLSPSEFNSILERFETDILPQIAEVSNIYIQDERGWFWLFDKQKKKWIEISNDWFAKHFELELIGES